MSSASGPSMAISAVPGTAGEVIAAVRQSSGEMVHPLVRAAAQSVAVVAPRDVQPIDEHVHFGEQLGHPWCGWTGTQPLQSVSGETDQGHVADAAGAHLASCASPAACCIGSPPENVSPRLRGRPAAPASPAASADRAGTSGIQSGDMQPRQLKGQPCTHTTERTPGPSAVVPTHVAATFSDTCSLQIPRPRAAAASSCPRVPSSPPRLLRPRSRVKGREPVPMGRSFPVARPASHLPRRMRPYAVGQPRRPRTGAAAAAWPGCREPWRRHRIDVPPPERSEASAQESVLGDVCRQGLVARQIEIGQRQPVAARQHPAPVAVVGEQVQHRFQWPDPGLQLDEERRSVTDQRLLGAAQHVQLASVHIDLDQGDVRADRGCRSGRRAPVSIGCASPCGRATRHHGCRGRPTAATAAPCRRRGPWQPRSPRRRWREWWRPAGGRGGGPARLPPPGPAAGPAAGTTGRTSRRLHRRAAGRAEVGQLAQLRLIPRIQQTDARGDQWGGR